MKIALPQWSPEFDSKISEGAYCKLLDEVRVPLDRCLQIYEAYCRTGNDLLYDTFEIEVKKLHAKFHLLSVVGNWHELWDKSDQLAKAAEIVSGADELPFKATMLYDLAGAVRGK